MTAECEGCAVRRHVGTAPDAGAPAGRAPADHPSSAGPGIGATVPEQLARPTHRRPNALPGLSEDAIKRLLEPVTPDGDRGGGSNAVERFARAALSTAVEPGDLDAGRLVAALGPVALLRLIVSDVDARGVRNALRAAAREGGVGALPGAVAAASGDGVHDASSGESGESGGARSERRIAECLARWRPRLSLSESCRAVERAARVGAYLLTPDGGRPDGGWDDGWPDTGSESDAGSRAGGGFWPAGFASLEEGEPLALWVRGDPERLACLARSIALVGARASTEYGEHIVMESAAGLSDRGFVIVSGGAYGIDAAAHRATVASGGVTVAFLAGGVDRLYPAGNSDLLRRISAEGVLAAELPPGNAPTRWRFLIGNPQCHSDRCGRRLAQADSERPHSGGDPQDAP